MSDIHNNKYVLFKRWQSLRVYNIVILSAFLFFYALGTIQSYSAFSPPAMFNLPLFIPITAIFLCVYLIHCLIENKNRHSVFLLPVLTLFSTLFITINGHFETEVSRNSFLYFSLLLPLFYTYILSYNFQLLIANNFIVVLSYVFSAIVGQTSGLVLTVNLFLLLVLIFLTLSSHIKINANLNKKSLVKTPQKPTFNQQNSAYLKSIIHDIRQPLSSLALYTHLLEKQIEGSKHSVLIDNLLASSNQLDRWLSSLLELAILDSKSLPINEKNIPIDSCFSNVIKKHTKIAESKSMLLKVRLVKAVIFTDSKLLCDIIDHLIDNAFIHGTQEKGTTVLLTARHLNPQAIHIQIWNKGVAINNEHLNSLFDELYYSKNPNHNKAKGLGLGLGLALSQRKAHLLNTSIKVKTSEKGSCFSITIKKAQNRLNCLYQNLLCRQKNKTFC
ncbi:sensor histidine kinase [Psychromonas sp. KJ10-10]|uniref:sensor histidine kinase n=1 Tax=Psychromonas sp. KJ10-10 TaxID=3391823 RepID=UPI0039B41BAA